MLRTLVNIRTGVKGALHGATGGLAAANRRIIPVASINDKR
jgi:hypothetical protein